VEIQVRLSGMARRHVLPGRSCVRESRGRHDRVNCGALWKRNRNNGFLRQPIFTMLGLVKDLNDDQGLKREGRLVHRRSFNTLETSILSR
jgi:hypothetical protein